MRALALATLLALAAPAAAQEGPATLVADSVRVEAGGARLVAEGAVEVAAGGRVLRARRVTYLRDEDRLVVEGPLTVTDGPDTVLVADAADLGADLRDSVLEGARLVLDRRLQIAAAAVERGADGRFAELDRAVASSCTICALGEVPLWRIRARRVVYDERERQLFFEGARFDVLGVPVAWLPFFRLPGPTVERARGLLVPTFLSDDRLGTGIALPYFVPLGPSRDLTFTPSLSTGGARALGLRYREAYRAGALELRGALGRDGLRGNAARGYLFGEAAFALPGEWRLTFDVQTVTDDTYLLDYDITEDDLLESRAALERVRRDRRTVLEAVAFRSLRDADSNGLLPTRLANVEQERRFSPRVLGGQAALTLGAQLRVRPAGAPPAGAAADSARDVLRASTSLEWRRSWVTAPGLVVTGLAELHLDAYRVRQDRGFGDGVTARAVPYAGVELRLPLARSDASGARHLLEPVAQLVLAPERRDPVPRVEGRTPELDEANLLETGRFPGRDTRELGDRATLGLSYARVPAAPDGLRFGGTVGRLWRGEDVGQFDPGSGLDAEASDWLLATHAGVGDAVVVLSRTLLDARLDVTRSETILRWAGERAALETRYTWLEADVVADRPRDTSEWALDLAHPLGGGWTGRVNWRYDFVEDEASRAGLGLTYRGDCVTVGVDLSRRFTAADDLEPSTRIGLAVELAGFGAERRSERRRTCGI